MHLLMTLPFALAIARVFEISWLASFPGLAMEATCSHEPRRLALSPNGLIGAAHPSNLQFNATWIPPNILWGDVGVETSMNDRVVCPKYGHFKLYVICNYIFCTGMKGGQRATKMGQTVKHDRRAPEGPLPTLRNR